MNTAFVHFQLPETSWAQLNRAAWKKQLTVDQYCAEFLRAHAQDLADTAEKIWGQKISGLR